MRWSFIPFFILCAVIAAHSLTFGAPDSNLSASDKTGAEFCLECAVVHLETISQAAHPAGSPENATVRAYIANTVESYGLKAELQVTVSSGTLFGNENVAWVKNVIARVPGTESRDAVLLAAHYDTVELSPGAGDNGAAVAALLEVMRALLEGNRPAHDVIFLFSDGEELGGLGARAFVAGHSRAENIAFAMNFEGRGASGPVIMFETGSGSASQLADLAAVDNPPLVGSVAPLLYALLPFETDFTAFRKAGWPGFNFAFVEDATRYHASTDTARTLDRNSLFHHGTIALDFVRSFDIPERLPAQQSATSMNYLSVPFAGIIRYPSVWNLALVSVLAMCAIAAVASLYRSGDLAARRLVVSTGLVLIIALASVLAAVLSVTSVSLLGEIGLLSFPGTYSSLIAVAAVFMTMSGLQRTQMWAGPGTLLSGIMLFWIIVAVVFTILLPEAAYVVMVPAIASLCGTATVFVHAQWRYARIITTCLMSLAVALPVIVYLPFLHGFAQLLNAFAGVPVALIVAFVTTSAAASFLVSGPNGARVWKRFLGGSFLAFLGATVLFAFDASIAGSPQSNSLLYVKDADQEQAHWVSFDEVPDAWTSLALSGQAEPGSYNMSRPWADPEHIAKAPYLALPPPVVSLTEPLAGEGKTGIFNLVLRSQRSAYKIFLQIDSDVTITGLKIDGHAIRFAEGSDGWSGAVHGCPVSGCILEVQLAKPSELRISVSDAVPDLFLHTDLDLVPRPAGMVPSAFRPTDMTIVGRSYVF
jgi:hypothetical protein